MAATCIDTGYAQTRACTVLGSEAVPVVVEATVTRGLPVTTIIGLRGSEAAETRERVKCGLASLGIDPNTLQRTVVSIAPADLPKSGASLDLAIALAILAAMGRVSPASVARIACHGELALDGRLRAADGVVASAFAATRAGVEEMIAAAGTADRAARAPVRIRAARSLAQVVAHLNREQELPVATAAPFDTHVHDERDFSDVRAQELGVEAAIVAAAGGHHLLLFGPPGCGKSMIAQRLPTILPPLSAHAALEVATIHDAAGLRTEPVGAMPPFRAPHHTVSQQALVGGGGTRPLVGEITLAHRGVLFLDELPEFRPSAIDALRQPLEDREVRMRRAGWVARWPCATQLVAAMNLCRCGKRGTLDDSGGCICSETSRAAYASRVSGAIIDRFDVRARLTMTQSLLDTTAPGVVSSADAAARVARARAMQRARWGGDVCNGHLDFVNDPRVALSPAARARVERLAIRAGGGRVQRALVRVARTVADLSGSVDIGDDDVLAAWELVRSDPGSCT